jgi:hypothetical protein
MKTKNINGKSGAYVTREKYESVRQAMLEILPKEGEGLTLEEIVAEIETRVPAELFPKGVTWYTVTVKLDLEARGMVKRIPKTSPIRHLKITDVEGKSPE